MEFLLSRNRINVAVSRGQWRAVVVRSPELTNYLPTHPEGLERLGGFIGLCQRSAADPARSPTRGTCPFLNTDSGQNGVLPTVRGCGWTCPAVRVCCAG